MRSFKENSHIHTLNKKRSSNEIIIMIIKIIRTQIIRKRSETRKMYRPLFASIHSVFVNISKLRVRQNSSNHKLPYFMRAYLF
jgi:hypothetical protein